MIWCKKMLQNFVYVGRNILSQCSYFNSPLARIWHLSETPHNYDKFSLHEASIFLSYVLYPEEWLICLSKRWWYKVDYSLFSVLFCTLCQMVNHLSPPNYKRGDLIMCVDEMCDSFTTNEMAKHGCFSKAISYESCNEQK